jgi:hypothetical protein
VVEFYGDADVSTRILAFGTERCRKMRTFLIETLKSHLYLLGTLVGFLPRVGFSSIEGFPLRKASTIWSVVTPVTSGSKRMRRCGSWLAIFGTTVSVLTDGMPFTTAQATAL